MYFENRKHRHSWQFRWHVVFTLIIIVTGLLFLVGMIAGPASDGDVNVIQVIARAALWGAILFAAFSILLLLREAVQSLKKNSEILDNTVEMLSRQNNLLVKISQASRLSDTAKEIVFRDSEQMELAESALTKLHQHDFDEAESMVRAIGKHPKYKELAERLAQMTTKYRSATEEGRVNQIISHIEDLFDQKRWIQAAGQIENLTKMFPYSEKAKTMPQRLRESKDRQKSELLAEWDLAVHEKDTDRGLEILKELDLYLTPNEALALRESASTVFKTKLHNLGVEFSVAVADQNWKKALQTGRNIVQNFPNSRMASEIRGKMDILQERAKQVVS